MTLTEAFDIRAPISKVVGYLPTDIPRILINRGVVHPKHSTTEDDDEDENDPRSKDFRENYVFDAYLLGFCDVVTRALAKSLFSDNNSSGIQDTEVTVDGSCLLTNLENDNANFKPEEWKSTSVPTDRVFLFPGAQPPDNTESEDMIEYSEIVHCDECSNQIMGYIHKCNECFDYDLCQSCFPELSQTHFDGSHSFHKEKL